MLSLAPLALDDEIKFWLYCERSTIVRLISCASDKTWKEYKKSSRAKPERHHALYYQEYFIESCRKKWRQARTIYLGKDKTKEQILPPPFSPRGLSL